MNLKPNSLPNHEPDHRHRQAAERAANIDLWERREREIGRARALL